MNNVYKNKQTRIKKGLNLMNNPSNINVIGAINTFESDYSTGKNHHQFRRSYLPSSAFSTLLTSFSDYFTDFSVFKEGCGHEKLNSYPTATGLVSSFPCMQRKARSVGDRNAVVAFFKCIKRLIHRVSVFRCEQGEKAMGSPIKTLAGNWLRQVPNRKTRLVTLLTLKHINQRAGVCVRKDVSRFPLGHSVTGRVNVERLLIRMKYQKGRDEATEPNCDNSSERCIGSQVPLIWPWVNLCSN